MTETHVSAIITAYNSELFVEDAILSVLRQSRPVDEIVVIDDGSTDNTAAVAAKFEDKGVRYFYQENQGPSAARNRGIQETSGNLLAFLDADDTWLENKNQIQVEYLLSHPQVVMVSGLRWRFDGREDTQRVSGKIPKNSEVLRRDIVIHNLIGNPSMITVRRGVFETVGLFDSGIRWGQDWDMWIRIVSIYEVAILPFPVIVYRIHPTNHSYTKRRQVMESYLNISRRAIRASRPLWLRPLLLIRAWSRFAHEMALDAKENEKFRLRQIGYSLIALILYPWDKGRDKLNTLVHSILGAETYKSTKRLFRNLFRARG